MVIVIKIRAGEDMSKSVSPILVYGGAICKSSPSGAQSRNVVHLEKVKASSSTSSGLCARKKYDLDRFSILLVS